MARVEMLPRASSRTRVKISIDTVCNIALVMEILGLGLIVAAGGSQLVDDALIVVHCVFSFLTGFVCLREWMMISRLPAMIVVG